MFDNIFNSFKDNQNYNCFLSEVGNLAELDKDLSKYIRSLYNSSSNELRLATILNSIFHQNLQTFMFSRDTLIELYKIDTMNSYRSLSNAHYKFLLERITNCKEFEVLRQPTSNKAGVYKLVEPKLVNLLHKNFSKNFFEAQEKFALDYYDKDRKNKRSELIIDTSKEAIQKRKQDSLERMRNKLKEELGEAR